MRAFILLATLLSEASSAFVPHAPNGIASRSARAAHCSIKASPIFHAKQNHRNHGLC